MRIMVGGQWLVFKPIMVSENFEIYFRAANTRHHWYVGVNVSCGRGNYSGPCYTGICCEVLVKFH
jgi:hypothetical protein